MGGRWDDFICSKHFQQFKSFWAPELFLSSWMLSYFHYIARIDFWAYPGYNATLIIKSAISSLP